MAATLDIDVLRSFTVIADAGSFSRAAIRLAKTQSALSMQIKRLEELTGHALLHRGGRGVTLTSHGEKLVGYAKEILRLHDHALADLSGRGLSGSLKFGCPDDYAACFLPQLVGEFTRLHPAVFIEIICGTTQQLHHRLRRKEIDLALISVEETDREDTLRTEPLVWVGQPHSPVWEVSPLPLALSEKNTFDHKAAISSLQRQKRSYRIVYASGSLTGLIAVVRSGQAIAVLTKCAVPSDIQELPKDIGLPALPQLGITLAFSEETTSSLVEKFSSHIEKVLPILS
ncbi:LysR family transcriptional regulator [Acetobacter sp. DmW_136]|uniref:LysR family transcriptional regulator n=1 Tax=Acetobacter sp. DmW_136 TaxID=2591091 RepID=UPI00123A04BD|nr:LysR family transcriptional regulator [Acetobacter sp. DmW_136]KAA8385951.1 LysR family transcriptional regulator [Acetobacter sp. DmW_136]